MDGILWSLDCWIFWVGSVVRVFFLFGRVLTRRTGTIETGAVFSFDLAVIALRVLISDIHRVLIPSILA